MRRKTAVDTPVASAPKPLITARRFQRDGRVLHQCTTSPVCDSVNPVKTPMAKRGMRRWVLPSTATSKPPEKRASTTMPLLYIWRSPRTMKKWGR